MKILTLTQFKKLLNDAKIVSDYNMEDIAWTADELPDMQYGYLWNTLIVEGLIVTYQEGYEHPEHKPSLCVTTTDIPETWNFELQEFNVHDVDGEILSKEEIWDIVNEHTDIVNLDSSILGEDTVITLPGTVGDNMIMVESFNHANIAFTGDIIADVSTSTNNASPDYSGNVGVWEEYTVYETTHGARVLKRVNGTQWDNDETKTYSMVAENNNEISLFFGEGELAHELYRKL